MRLYELTEEYDRLLDMEGEEAEQALMVVCADLQKKAGNICKFLANCDSDVEAIKAEESRLAARRKAIENTSKKVKDYVKMQMAVHDISKIDAGTFKLSLSPSSGSVEIDDMEQLPPRFKTIVQEVKVDKTAIKAAIKSGEDVPGCHIDEGYTLRIK